MGSSFLKSDTSANELVMRLCTHQYEEINILFSKCRQRKKMPHTNPFLAQEFIKHSVSCHEQMGNMKYTQKRKIQFTTKDPICAVKFFNLKTFTGKNVVTGIIWETFQPVFGYLTCKHPPHSGRIDFWNIGKNDSIVMEMRRFVKLHTTKELSPVLIT